jgi:HEAT repeat protein
MNDAQNPCQDQAVIQAMVQTALDQMQNDELDEHPVLWRLQRCASVEVFEGAKRLCKSKKLTERVLGVDILGQFGTVATDEATATPRLERMFAEETVSLLLEMLATETEPEVLYSLGVALGHMQESRAIEPLCRLKTHTDAHVRYGVVFGLLCQEDELAIRTLIELSQDSDAMVRDWATFGLGSQLEIDTPEIRNALMMNIDDIDEQTRYEALVGLAVRRDERILERVIDELVTGCVDVDSDIGVVFCEMLKVFQQKLNSETLTAALRKCDNWLISQSSGCD